MRKQKSGNVSLTRFILLMFLVGMIAAFTSSCREYEMKSQWCDRNITVDGNTSDWVGLLGYVEDKNISVGILNDEKFLYICLISEDRSRRMQVMAQGMILWFDPDGGKNKTFGIRFPIGRPQIDPGERQAMMRAGEIDRDKMCENTQRILSELEILGPGKEDVQRISLADMEGIAVGFDRKSDMLTYELKVPLAVSEELKHAVKTRPGKTIGIGIEIPKMDRSAMDGSPRSGMSGGKTAGRMPGGGMGGRGGGGMTGSMRGGQGGMSGRGGMGSRQRPDMFKDLKVWITVPLASK
jgi:hypothetical protein